MRQLLKKLLDWLIVRLGGVPRQEWEKTLNEWCDTQITYEDRIAILEMELDMKKQDIHYGTETLAPTKIASVAVLDEHFDFGPDLIQDVKDELTQQILGQAKQAISYHITNAAYGQNRISATLYVLKRPAPIREQEE